MFLVSLSVIVTEVQGAFRRIAVGLNLLTVPRPTAENQYLSRLCEMTLLIESKRAITKRAGSFRRSVTVKNHVIPPLRSSFCLWIAAVHRFYGSDRCFRKRAQVGLHTTELGCQIARRQPPFRCILP
jgi:hypothetical protein